MTKPAITQAMIDAYDEYTHLTLDRRGFMEKLTKLAGSGAAAAMIAPMLAASSARAAIVPEDDSRLKAEEITRGGSVCLNSDWGFAKWISALVMPLPGLASAH